MTKITEENQKSKSTKEFNLEAVRITNSLLFKHIMKNTELCKELLEVVLGVKIRKIVYKETEKELDLSLDAKSVRLDVYLEDEDEDEERIAYDIEMQATDTKHLPKRSRYYQGMIDLNLIDKGRTYDELPKSFIIFICPFDLFGQGRSIYTFEHICLEDKSIHLGDEATKIFLNANNINEDIGKELSAFLKYVKDGTMDSEFVRKLDDEMKKVKENAEWRREHMSLYAHDCDLLRQGREEGREEGSWLQLLQLIIANHNEFSVEVGAKIFGCDIEIVDEVYRILDSEQGMHSAQSIYDKLTASGHIKKLIIE